MDGPRVGGHVTRGLRRTPNPIKIYSLMTFGAILLENQN